MTDTFDPFASSGSPVPLDALEGADDWSPDDYGDAPRGPVAPRKVHDDRTPSQVVELGPPPLPWRSPVERALALGYAGERVALGLPSLDAATRGGLIPRTLVILGGAPGAGKTLTGLCVARWLWERGYAVAIIAADEGADGLLIRWGQGIGLRREALEQGDPDARAVLAESLDSSRLILADQSEDQGATIELVAEHLARLAEPTGKPGILLVDSIQTARSGASDAADNPRAKVDAVVTALRTCTRAHGLVTLATSEMARGFYRGGGVPGTDALAAFKESGSIEFQADVALALTTPKGEPSAIDVQVAKSRPGGRGTVFRLAIDHATATVTEVDIPDEAIDEEDRSAAQAKKVEDTAKAMLLALARHPTAVLGQRQLRALVPGRASVKAEAVAWLMAHGRIAGGGREPYRAVSQPAGEDES